MGVFYSFEFDGTAEEGFTIFDERQSSHWYSHKYSSFLRWVGSNTSPFSCILQVTCLLLLFAVELGAETNGTDTMDVGIPRSKLVTYRAIKIPSIIRDGKPNMRTLRKDSFIALSKTESTS